MSLVACWIIKLISCIFGLLPLPWALFLGRCVGRSCYVLHKRKWAGYVNIRAAFPGKYTAREIQGIVARSYENLAQTFVELLRFPYVKQPYVDTHFKQSPGATERIKKALSHGHGVVFLTAHLDNWELAGLYASYCGFPLKVLVTEQKHSQVNDLLNAYREIPGNTVIGKGMPLRELLAALKNNDLVAIVGDQGGKPGDFFVPFFDRLAATPAGAFRIAKKMKSTILPCMMVRKQNGHHDVNILDEISLTNGADDEACIHSAASTYVRILEEYIANNPDQWMWMHKRWKYCRTKRITIVSDAKAGHLNQSNGVYAMLVEGAQTRVPEGEQPYVCELQTITIAFRSYVREKAFRCLAPLFIPFARTHLDLLRYFLTPASYEALRDNYCDVVISCGAGALPFALMLKQENRADNVLVMKPSFPYTLFHHDLIIKHAHDVMKDKEHIITTVVAPSVASSAFIEREAAVLRTRYNLSKDQRYVSILIGGDTKKYVFDIELFTACVQKVKALAEKLGYRLVVSNSRRTRPDISKMLDGIFNGDATCDMFIDVRKDNPENCVYGMIGLSDIVFVTEESVSMISEAVQSRKKVFVMQPAHTKVAKKHAVFHKHLVVQDLIQFFDYTRTITELIEHTKHAPAVAVLDDVADTIKQELASLL